MKISSLLNPLKEQDKDVKPMWRVVKVTELRPRHGNNRLGSHNRLVRVGNYFLTEREHNAYILQNAQKKIITTWVENMGTVNYKGN